MSLATLGNSLAPLFFAAVFTALLEKLGYTGAMLILSGFVLHSLPACALYRPLPEPKSVHVLIVTEPPEKEQLANIKDSLPVSTDKDTSHVAKDDEMYHEQENVGHRNRARQESSKCVKLLFDCSRQFVHLKNITFLIYGLTMTSMTINNGCVYAFLPALCIEKGFTATQIALLFILSGCADCIGRFCGGFFYDLRAFRTRRVWIHGIIGAMTGLLTISIALPIIFTPWVVTLMVCLRAVCIGVFNGQRMTVMADVVGNNKMAACVGLVLWFQGIGSSFGILLAGAIKDWFGSFFAVYLYGGGVLTVFCMLYTVQHFVLSLCCLKGLE